MKLSDAANLLNLSGTITKQDVKSAFRQAAKKYHPDINPAGADMMKIINEAFDTLKDFEGEIENHDIEFSYPDEVNAALNAIKDCAGLQIEICGAWVWVTGETREHKDILKSTGFKWANKKKAWSYRPSNWKSKSRGGFSMDDIRATHGSQAFKSRNTFAIAAE